MITKEESSFNATMGEIMEFLELKNYSNNNLEHFSNISKFLKKYYPKININTVDFSDSKNFKFKMSLDNKDLFGIFYYSQLKGDLGEYKLKIYEFNLEGNEIELINFDFRRTYNASLDQLFFDNKVH